MASLFDACRDIKPLESGGQKEVYSANHPIFGKVVIKTGRADSTNNLERIKREVEILRTIRSKYYPKQFDLLIQGNDFEIMEEFVQGSQLRKVMSKFTKTRDIFLLIKSLIDGLSVIWDKDIVHRDLKPENIIITPNGDPYIIDLGIARKLDAKSLTQTFDYWGPCTLEYASPEQLRNKKNMIDCRTDFFNLGIITLELFLGVHPFDPNIIGNNDTIYSNILNNKYISSISTKKDAIITEFASKTLQTVMHKRFRTHRKMKAFIQNHI